MITRNLSFTSSGENHRASRPVRQMVCAVGLTVLLASHGSYATQPSNPKDLTQGNWSLDLSKSKFCKPAPKSTRRSIFDAGWGLMVVHWTGIDQDDKPVDTRYIWRYDGQKYPATIDRADDAQREAISWKLVSPSRVEFVHWSKANKITEELVRTVSADGQEMTQSRKYLGGAECVDVQVFRRD